MIIKNYTTRLIFPLLIFFILPFVQKQWFNLYLFNINNVSIYLILYYISGIICPSLISLNSLNYFTNYSFKKNKINSKNIIKGKNLLFIVVINLIFLSYLITNYFYINFNLLTNLFIEGIKFQQLNIFQHIFFILFIGILLIFKKSRIFVKKMILVNFVIISFFIWYIQINSIKIDDQFYIYKFIVLENINVINILFLFFIELLYFLWSFVSYKTNLSDWLVSIPKKSDMLPVFNILIFYFFIIFYYSLFI